MNIIENIKSTISSGLFSYTLPEEELQRKIEPLFPREFEKFLCSFNLTAPKVFLAEDSDKIGWKSKSPQKCRWSDESQELAGLKVSWNTTL